MQVAHHDIAEVFRRLDRLETRADYQSLWVEAVSGELCDLEDALLRATDPDADEDEDEMALPRLLRVVENDE